MAKNTVSNSQNLYERGDGTLVTPVVRDAAQTWTGQQTFTATGSGTTGAIVTNDVTVKPNAGISGSASMFLDNTVGQVWEFFDNSSGNFGVFDKTNSKQPFSIAANTNGSALGLSGTDVSIDSSCFLRVHGALVTSGSVQAGRTAVNSAASPYSVSATADCIIACDPTGGVITVTLPNVNYAALEYIIKDETGQAATHNITVNSSGGLTIDGAASKVISSSYGVLRVYSNGTNWSTW